MCNCFLPAIDKDSLEFCGQWCNINHRNWSTEQWEKVSSHTDKLAEQYESKEKKKGMFKLSSFSSFSNPHAVPLLVSELSLGLVRVIIILFLHQVPMILLI